MTNHNFAYASMRRLRHLLPAAALAVAVAGCDTDDIFTVEPTTIVPAATAIVDQTSALSATAGLYDALQSGSYYGESFVNFVELSSDNASHTGTFSTYATADNYQTAADNSTVGGIWSAIYSSIARANAVIDALTTPSFPIDEAVQNDLLGQAYLVRALGYHNLVKLWEGVPIITTVVSTPTQAADVTRGSVANVYTQINADLDAAGSRLGVASASFRASRDAVAALRARVKLYQGDYAGALAAANAVPARALATPFGALFDPLGNATSEDVWRVRFTDQDASSVSYYYKAKSLGGRREVGPTGTGGPSATLPYGGIRFAFATADAEAGIPSTAQSSRRAWSVSVAGTTVYVSKFPSSGGTEGIHIIRYAEVLLIKAEAQARLGSLSDAITTLNLVRARAGLTPRTLGTMTQAQVIEAVISERRLELAFEGDRWPDLIRLGRAVGVVSALCGAARPCTEQARYPIPQTELDVWNNPNQQNSGY